MKRLLFVLLAWAAFQPVLALAADPDPDPDPEAQYQTLLAAAKSGAGPVDWQALRFAYAERPGFDGDFDHKVRQDMFMASNAENWATVQAKAKVILDANYADGMTHYALGVADMSLGDMAGGRRERAMAEAIFASIQTGDGLTFEHAFTTISVEEENDILATLGKDQKRQSLTNHNGHLFRVVDAEDGQDKKTTYYFNVDRESAAETRMLAPK